MLDQPVEALQIRLLYSFSGEASIGDITIDAGESVYLDSGDAAVVARSDADLVLFTTNPTAPIFKGGMFSGNVVGSAGFR
ncbi:hypothetical protein LJR255_004440 [Pararhizobium sp. LjRoot255]|uniref:hypothetical protein n=1 Tax=Pararhizobium sp. LjRoot255 TaxID=3342298 RepID=UPI003ECC46F3